MRNIKSLVLASAGAMLMAQGAQAALTYANGDMLLGFRVAGGTSNLEVDLGSVNQLNSILGTGLSMSFNQFTAGDITAGVGTAGSGSLNNAIWSVSAGINALNQNSITAAKNTLWLTSGRGVNSADINTQTTAWTRQAVNAQGNTVSPVVTVGAGFAAASGNASSTTAAVIADGANSYHDNITDNGNYNTFVGNIENTLASNFTTAGVVSRSDYYQMAPGTGSGTYLGYFELSTAGALSFVAVPESSTYAATFAAGLMALALMRAHRKSLVNS